MGFGSNYIDNANNKPNEYNVQQQSQSVVPAKKVYSSIFNGMTHDEAVESGLEADFKKQDKNQNNVIDLNELTVDQYIEYLEEKDSAYSRIDLRHK